jgi:hypothetical protein
MARTAGLQAKDALRWCSARLRTGFDLGHDSATAWLSPHVKDTILETHHTQVLDNVHGLCVYDDAMPTVFFHSSLDTVRGKGTQPLLDAMSEAFTLGLNLTTREALAFELYSAAQFERSARARFLTLITVIEALGQPKPRRPKAVAHVEELIDLTRQSGLTAGEIDSLTGSMNWLKSESISRTGRDLVEGMLGGEQFGNMRAKDFFAHCYEVRSQLVHLGKQPSPDIDMGTLATELDRLVASLLLRLRAR